MVLVFHFSLVHQVHSEDVSADQLLDQIESGKAQLKEGMTKIEVANLIGKPFNDSDQNVWIWCFEPKRNEKKLGWREYLRRGGMFLVFVNGKTIKGIRSTVACSHEEVYSSVYRIDEKLVPYEYRITE